MTTCYALASTNGFSPDPEDIVIDSIFKQYERVIVESLITSFGLDFLVNDRHGGDVDTINNVRQVGKDENMTYKNKINQTEYENRGEYSYKEYHKDPNYRFKKSEARNRYNDLGEKIEDAYTGGKLQYIGNNKNANPKITAELDHVISANSIHNDRGRVLSGLKGENLANSPENLQFTNKSLNASMQDSEIPDYIDKHPELSSDVKEKMMKHYNNSKSLYEKKLAAAYYTSPKFAKDVSFAAVNVGVKMGIRQALGFVFAEMWFAVKEEFENIGPRFDLGELLAAIGKGIKHGFENAKEKYKELFAKFREGVVAGALSSLTTTLCNIFFTTAKNVVKIIRQSYVFIVQAAKVLFINPDNLLFGERIQSIVKTLAIGASVVAGGLVTEALGKTAFCVIPAVGDIVQTFCGAFVTGILSCTLLYFFDRSDITKNLVLLLNNIHTIETEVNYYYMQAEYFEKFAAELMIIDLKKFQDEAELCSTLTHDIESAKNEQELNDILLSALNEIGVKIPWEGDFDSFISNKSSVLVFE